VLQADPFQHLKRAALAGREIDAEHSHDEGDVVEHREAGNQPEILEHEPDRAAIGLDVRRGKIGQRPSANLQLPVRRSFCSQQ
jgi:hypothetical protein